MKNTAEGVLMTDWDGRFESMPRTHRFGGPLVPDLTRIPEEHWREVLLPLTEAERRDAVFNFALGDRMQAAIALSESLPPGLSMPKARASRAEGTTVPAPGAERRQP